MPTLILILRDLVYSAFRLWTACDRLSWDDTTVGDVSFSDAGVEGKAPGVMFNLGVADSWMLLVAIVRKGATVPSEYARVTSGIQSIALWDELK